MGHTSHIPELGAVNGIAQLDGAGQVPLSQLGNFVSSDMAGVQARRSTTLALPATFEDMTFDITDVENIVGDVEHTVDDRILLHTSGLHLITYSMVIDLSNTSDPESRLRVNDTTVLEASESASSTNSNNSVAILFDQVLYDATAGDFVSLQTQDTGSPVGVARAHASISVVKLTGQRGPVGPAGAGSTVTIENSDTPAANTPHSILNFRRGLQASDAGGGQANLDLDINGLTIEATPLGADLIVVYDVSAGQERKVTIASLPSSGAQVDNQSAQATPGSTTTATGASWDDVPGATLTTVGTGTKGYQIVFTGDFEHSSASQNMRIRLMVAGVPLVNSVRTTRPAKQQEPSTMATNSTLDLASGIVVKLQYQVVEGGTMTVGDGTLSFLGVN